MGNVRVTSPLNASVSLIHHYSHIEGPSTAFGTSLNYCAIRILGMSADHPVATKARGCLHKLGRFLTPLVYSLFLPIVCSSIKVLLWPRPLGVNSGSQS